MGRLVNTHWLPMALFTGIIVYGVWSWSTADSVSRDVAVADPKADSLWQAPSLYLDRSLQGEERQLVMYGEELIAHTARYLGPRGSVAPMSNGMNCQNCHLSAGRLAWGNNYGAVQSTYPRYRDRSGGMENVYKRVSDCFQRSLNGRAPDSVSREFQAIAAYIRWLGRDVPKGVKPVGSGLRKLAYLDRAADPARGALVYAARCASCHGSDGLGVMAADGLEYQYPPLWGEHSYNTGAGLFRISNFAGYVHSNMPFNQATDSKPVLTTQECWDVAAYVNSQPRPSRDPKGDWPDISKKPVDHPYGPYADGHTELQHKYGPFPPILASRKKAEGGRETRTATPK